MKKVLQSVFINSTDKEGNPLVSKAGEHYRMCNVLFEGDVNKYSMYIGSKYGQKDFELVSTWQPGMEVDVTLEQNGMYWNFKIPNKTDLLSERVNELDNRLRQICLLNGLKTKSDVTGQVSQQNASQSFVAPNKEVSVEDLPW